MRETKATKAEEDEDDEESLLTPDGTQSFSVGSPNVPKNVSQRMGRRDSSLSRSPPLSHSEHTYSLTSTNSSQSSPRHLPTSGLPGFIPGYSTGPGAPTSYSDTAPPQIFATPPLSTYFRPHILDEVLPRDMVVSVVIPLFFGFIYPLSPCFHRPSFMSDLSARREERDPLFFALVMSCISVTLVQVPASYFPMERGLIRDLSTRCHDASRHISVGCYDPPSLIHVVIRYL